MPEQFLNKTMVFHPTVQTPHKLITETGGPAAEIPEKDRCVSGKHNLRLTVCYCDWK
jgi:hypothetical protein